MCSRSDNDGFLKRSPEQERPKPVLSFLPKALRGQTTNQAAKMDYTSQPSRTMWEKRSVGTGAAGRRSLHSHTRLTHTHTPLNHKYTSLWWIEQSLSCFIGNYEKTRAVYSCINHIVAHVEFFVCDSECSLSPFLSAVRDPMVPYNVHT